MNVSSKPPVISLSHLCFSSVAIQDLVFLKESGLLLSCAYDGKIICWRYHHDVEHGRVIKENQQLRTMGAVTESGTLLIGTNTFAILTQSITEWVNHRDYDFEYQQAIEGDYSDEENKYDDDYDENDVDWNPNNYA